MKSGEICEGYCFDSRRTLCTLMTNAYGVMRLSMLRRRSCKGILMVTISIVTFYLYYAVILKSSHADDHPLDKGPDVESAKRQVELNLTEVSPIKSEGEVVIIKTYGRELGKNTGGAAGSENVLDAEGNTIQDSWLREEVKKITAKVSINFLPEYKNPCWKDSKDELTCLPYFYLIGMSKCGTTDLWNKLKRHPDIIDVPKEPHWWGPRRTGWTGLAVHGQEVLKIREKTGGKDDSSIDWYLHWYKTFAVNDVQQAITNSTTGEKYYPKVFGDGSISTAYSIGNAWIKNNAGATNPPFTNAELLHAIQPKAKIIIMLRNPTERARSWYYYTHPLNTPDDWHINAMTSIECYNSCRKEHNERYCAYSFGCPYTPFQGINVGLYHIFLYDWINAYTREGVLVLRLEDWHKDQVSVYRTILDFLELRQLTPREEAHAVGARWNHVSNKVAQSQTKTALDDFYRPHNEKLADLLQSDNYRYQ